MLTAAVRDLHLAYPGEFETDVRTSCRALWQNNPYLTALAGDAPNVETIPCHYPLIHRSNRAPYGGGVARYLEGAERVAAERVLAS